MNKDDAIYFAGKCEAWLNIPSFVCEVIERKLMQGEYEEVCRFIVQRSREIDQVKAVRDERL